MSMGLHNLSRHPGATAKRKRVGRGPGSGLGKTAGRGNKGQKSRSGYSRRAGFEGGQMPLYRRLPKRGFTNIFRTELTIVNVVDLNRFEDDTVVTLDLLRENGMVSRAHEGLKVLGGGELERRLTVRANRFSESALAKITAAGGKAEVIHG